MECRIPNETTTVLKRIRILKRFSTSRKHERGAGNDSVSTTTTAAPMMSLLQYLNVRTGLLAGGIPSLPMPSPPPAAPDPLCSNAVTRDVTVIKTYEPEVIETSADDDCDGNSKAGRNQFRARTVKGGNNGVALRQYAEATLGGGSLRKVVKLPEGEDENEWLAVNSKGSQALKDSSGVPFWLTFAMHSGRLLQPDQSPLRRHHRVLLTQVVPRDEGNGRIRVSVAG